MSGFTLLELLLVITIIAILVALQLPTLEKVRFEAQKAECMNYKRQLKIFYYTTDFEDGSPPQLSRISAVKNQRNLTTDEQNPDSGCQKSFHIGWGTFQPLVARVC